MTSLVRSHVAARSRTVTGTSARSRSVSGTADPGGAEPDPVGVTVEGVRDVDRDPLGAAGGERVGHHQGAELSSSWSSAA